MWALVRKINKKLRYCWVRLAFSWSIYPYFYSSVLRSKFKRAPDKSLTSTGIANAYFTSFQNEGAGIGHQIANWNSGYWYAKYFGIKFAHVPFQDEKWEKLLNFGFGEKMYDDLIAEGYKKVNLPLFDDSNAEHIEMIKKIVEIHAFEKVILTTEIDQIYRRQCDTHEELRSKFFGTREIRNNNGNLSNEYKVAVHIRRGDIGDLRNRNTFLMRFLPVAYYVNVLDSILIKIPGMENLVISIFSNGDDRLIKENFSKYTNVKFEFKLDDYSTFESMVSADILVTSKSSFSYVAGFFSLGTVISPKDFWHEYPEKESWYQADIEGKIDWRIE